MQLKQIQLPSYPTELPANVEVRDVAVITDDNESLFFRVVMEVETTVKVDHFHMTAQCFQMNEDGSFTMAPNGYPSRSGSTVHTVAARDLGDTINVDDSWVRHTGQVTEQMLAEMKQVTARPSEPGERYGELVWDVNAGGAAGQAWRWQEGFADGTARAKIEDMLAVLRSSGVRSGFAFRTKGK